MTYAESLGWTLVHSVWQIALIGAILLVANLLLSRARPGTRYAVAALALVACLAAPVVTFIHLARPLASTHGSVLSAAKPIRAAATASPAMPTPAPSVPSLQEGVPGPIERSLPLLVRIWLVGLAVMCLRLVACLLAVERLKRRATGEVEARWKQVTDLYAKRLGIRRRIEVLCSESIAVPAVVGFFRVVILLPVSVATKMSPNDIEALIAHEIAHVSRCDYLANLLQSLLETLLFYHPVVWWISHLVRTEREQCCDDLAIRLLGDRAGYARALVGLEELRGAAGLALTANGRPLLQRIRRIVGASDRRRFSGSVWVSLALVLTISATFAGRILAQPRTTYHGGTQELIGEVLTADGTPAPGATVICQSTDRQDVVKNVRPRTRTVVVKADSAGVFHFNVSGNDNFTLTAYLKAKSIGILWPLNEPKRRPSYVVHLRPSRPRRVRLVDPSGNPVGGMRVGPVFVMFGPGSTTEVFDALSVLTDKQGWATIEGLPDDCVAQFDVASDRYAINAVARRFTPQDGSPDTQLTLLPTGEIDGVATLRGAPQRGALAPFFYSDKAISGLTRPGSDGEFQIKRLPEGTVFLRPKLSPTRSAYFVEPVKVEIKGGQKLRVQLKMQSGAQIDGEILDASGRPILGGIALVQDGPQDFFANSDTDGKFEITVPAGSYRVHALKHGKTSPDTLVDVKAGEHRSVTLTVR